MERPPRTIEYICLSCGTQGSIRARAESEDPGTNGGSVPRCPRCNGTVLYLERKAADVFSEQVPVGN